MRQRQAFSGKMKPGSQAAGFDDGDPAFAECYEEDDESSNALSTWSGHDACEISSEEPELKEEVVPLLHDDSGSHGAPRCFAQCIRLLRAVNGAQHQNAYELTQTKISAYFFRYNSDMSCVQARARRRLQALQSADLRTMHSAERQRAVGANSHPRHRGA